MTAQQFDCVKRRRVVAQRPSCAAREQCNSANVFSFWFACLCAMLTWLSGYNWFVLPWCFQTRFHWFGVCADVCSHLDACLRYWPIQSHGGIQQHFRFVHVVDMRGCVCAQLVLVSTLPLAPAMARLSVVECDHLRVPKVFIL